MVPVIAIKYIARALIEIGVSMAAPCCLFWRHWCDTERSYKYMRPLNSFISWLTISFNLGPACCDTLAPLFLITHTYWVFICRLIRRPEHLIGRHWYLPENRSSFISWSPDQWVSQCYAIECDISFCCALFCVFMTRVRQCPISLLAYCSTGYLNIVKLMIFL
jgi:hypothetical protein